MVSSKAWVLIAVTAVVFGLLLSGCGGGSDVPIVTGKVGNVTGLIVDHLTSSPLGGVKVTIGGKVALSDGNGHFTVSDIPKGTYDVKIEANPDTNLVLPPGAGKLTVIVYADQTVSITNTIYLWDRNDLPPDAPV